MYDYVVYIEFDFGEVIVRCSSDEILKDEYEALALAYETLSKSEIINGEKLNEQKIFYDVKEGEFLEG